MDSGDTLGKELAQQQQILEKIQKKLQEPELAEIARTLNMTEYDAIRKVLLKRPALFLLLLSHPVFDLFLTPNTREGFLKDLKENPKQVKSKLIAFQKAREIPLPTQNPIPELAQETSDSYADAELDFVQEIKETITEMYDQVSNFAAVYTPSLNNMTDTFSSFVDGLTCALPTIDPESSTEALQADGGKKKLTSIPK